VWADGVHRECSTDYHCIVLRSFLGALANARAADLDLPTATSTACRWRSTSRDIQRPDGLTPSFSDGDIVDFRQLLPRRRVARPRRSALGATGGEAGTPLRHLSTRRPHRRYLTARSGWGEASTSYGDERFMLMDAGPIGDGGTATRPVVGRAVRQRPFVGCRSGSLHYADTTWRRWFKGSQRTTP
jgi:hypothetical protein